jgi:hypothetical protein
MFGYIGIGRSSEFAFDYKVLHDAGRSWLSGSSPYITDPDWPFAYPPHSAFIFVPLSLLTFESARIGMSVVIVAAIASIALMTCRTIARETGGYCETKCLLMTAFIIANPFTLHNVWMGQTTLLVLASMMGAWTFSRDNRWVLSGVCLGFAGIKPHLSLLLFAWFLLERNWRVLAASAVTALVMSAYPFLSLGPIESVRSWIADGLGGYLSSGANTAGYRHVLGVHSLLGAAGIDLPKSLFKLSGLGLAFVVWMNRKSIDSFSVLGILLGVSLTLVYGHDYDYVLLIPLFTSLLIYANQRPNLWLLLTGLVLLIFVPQRLVRILGVPVLNHWRTLVVAALTVLVFRLAYSAKRPATVANHSE